MKGGDGQSRPGAKLLGGPADVGGDGARLEVWAVVTDGYIPLGEPKLANPPQCVRQRRRPETKCGTGNEHGNLRRVLAQTAARPKVAQYLRGRAAVYLLSAARARAESA